MRASVVKSREPSEWAYLPPSHTLSGGRSQWVRGDGWRVIKGLHGWRIERPGGGIVRNREKDDRHPAKDAVARFQTSTRARAWVDQADARAALATEASR